MVARPRGRSSHYQVGASRSLQSADARTAKSGSATTWKRALPKVRSVADTKQARTTASDRSPRRRAKATMAQPSVAQYARSHTAPIALHAGVGKAREKKTSNSQSSYANHRDSFAGANVTMPKGRCKRPSRTQSSARASASRSTPSHGMKRDPPVASSPSPTQRLIAPLVVRLETPIDARFRTTHGTTQIATPRMNG